MSIMVLLGEPARRTGRQGPAGTEDRSTYRYYPQCDGLCIAGLLMWETDSLGMRFEEAKV